MSSGRSTAIRCAAFGHHLEACARDGSRQVFAHLHRRDGIVRTRNHQRRGRGWMRARPAGPRRGWQGSNRHIRSRRSAGSGACNPGRRASGRLRSRSVNQRASTASAIAPMPFSRTNLARVSQFSGGGSAGAVAIRTRLSTRPGCRMASAWAMMPPRDSPTTCARSMPSAASSPSRSSASVSMVTLPPVAGERPCPRVS